LQGWHNGELLQVALGHHDVSWGLLELNGSNALLRAVSFMSSAADFVVPIVVPIVKLVEVCKNTCTAIVLARNITAP
jgi:hypothetical protein